jgi:hypothetical protein
LCGNGSYTRDRLYQGGPTGEPLASFILHQALSPLSLSPRVQAIPSY